MNYHQKVDVIYKRVLFNLESLTVYKIAKNAMDNLQHAVYLVVNLFEHEIYTFRSWR